MQLNTQPDNQQTTHRPKSLPLEKGFFHSCTVRLDPSKVFSLCQDRKNLKKVLEVLPEFVAKRIELDEIKQDIDQTNMKITWSNTNQSSVQFSANLFLSEAPAGRGTYMAAEAFFEVPKSKILIDILQVDDPEPSMLVGAFLRRLKALFETGEIATTKGQPNGNEEISSINEPLH